MQNLNYVVDVANPKIKWAIERLGINLEELQTKTLEDFPSSPTSKDTQYIRFEFYKRNIEKAIKLIIETSKAYSLNHSKQISSLEKLSKANDSSKETRFFNENKGKKKVLLNNKDKELIIHALESSKFIFATQTPKISEKSKRKVNKFQDFHKKQKENLRKLRDEQEKIWNRTVSPIKLPERLDTQGRTDITMHNRSTTNNEAIDIEEKLHSFEEKQAKSAIIHHNFLEKRKEIAKTQEKPRKVIETDEEVSISTLQKLIKKDSEVKKRKIKQFEEQKEKWDMLKRFKESKSLKLVRHNEEQLKQLAARATALHVKELQNQSIFNSHRQAAIKGLEIKAVIHKLKDEQASINAKRQQKIEYFSCSSYKKQVIIEKHLMEKEKFEEMKQMKEQKNIKSREDSIKDMIQRERMKDSVFRIQKSPLSKLSQRMIKDLQIDLTPERSKSINIRIHKKRMKSDATSPKNLN